MLLNNITMDTKAKLKSSITTRIQDADSNVNFHIEIIGNPLNKKLQICFLGETNEDKKKLKALPLVNFVKTSLSQSGIENWEEIKLNYVLRLHIEFLVFKEMSYIVKCIKAYCIKNNIALKYIEPFNSKSYNHSQIKMLLGFADNKSQLLFSQTKFKKVIDYFFHNSKIPDNLVKTAVIYAINEDEVKKENENDWKRFIDSNLSAALKYHVKERAINAKDLGPKLGVLYTHLKNKNYDESYKIFQSMDSTIHENAYKLIYSQAKKNIKEREYDILKFMQKIDGDQVAFWLNKLSIDFPRAKRNKLILETLESLKISPINHHYYAAWSSSLRFLSDKEFNVYLKDYRVEKITAENCNTSTRITYSKGKLTDIKKFKNGHYIETKYKNEVLGKKIQDYPIVSAYNFKKIDQGKNVIGGKAPEVLTIPEVSGVKFNYLGKLSAQEKAFSILSHDLYLCAPIYCDFDKLFLDYNNPLKPIVVKESALKLSHSEISNNLSSVNFEEYHFRLSRSKLVSEDVIGHSGFPLWIQAIDIPSCPKTGEEMFFLCQLKTHSQVKIIDHDYSGNLKFQENINFWGDGNLFIFYNPNSKIACYFIQNS